MTSFRFEAATADGRTVKGRLDAVSGTAVAAQLSRRGLYPLRVDPLSMETRWSWRRPSRRDLATVFQSLASLVDAGVPLEQALSATTDVVSGVLHDALVRVSKRVCEGVSLATALEAESGLFPGVVIGLVRGGEQGVGLGAALIQAATQLESEAESVARIRAALAYPILLLVVGTMSVGLIAFFIVPRFAELVTDVNHTLPSATRALLGVSTVTRSYGFVLVVGMGLLGFLSFQLTSRFPEKWHRWLLSLPVIGHIRHGLATARVCRTLGALFGTGTSALHALDVARLSVGDKAVCKRLASVRDSVSQGGELSVALLAEEAITPGAARLVRIGEGSGKLSALLFKAADLEERTAERRLKSLITILEPVLILLFAALVAFVAAALLQAIYSVRPGGV